MDLDAHYPQFADLARKAKRRIPKFVWEYLDSGTGDERTKARNRQALDRLGYLPSILHGEVAPDLSVTLMGQTFARPFGVAPLGMSGLIWPSAEEHLAQAAARAKVPYTLSTVAAAAPEDLAAHIDDQAWFQLYPPRDPDIRSDMLARAKAAGFKTLVLTVDLPAPSRRERQTRSGLTQPPRITPRLLWQTLQRPAWAWGMARQGLPHMRTLDAYVDAQARGLPSTAHVGYLLRVAPDWDYVAWLRDNWEGPFIAKGVLKPEDATLLEAMGLDALWVSTHAGRQFDGAPGAIDCLADVRAATKLPLIFDSGVETGLDILRAFGLGANFVMLGRAWHFALAALGAPQGPDHLVNLLTADLVSQMGHLNLPDLENVPPPQRLL